MEDGTDAVDGGVTLVVQFAGLMIHAPSVADVQAYSAETPVDGYTVLVPEARSGKLTYNYPPRRGGKPCYHVPYIRFKLNDAGLDAGSGADGMIRLDRHHVEFDGLADGTGVDWSAVAQHTADLRKAVPGEEVDPAHFSDTPPKTLCARVSLDRGSFHKAGLGELGEFEFKTHLHGEVTYKTTLARYLDWHAPLAGNSVTITLTPIDGGEVKTVTLSTDGSEISLRIANLCEDGFMDWDEFDDNLDPVVSDDDFAWYYTMLSAVPKPHELMPIPYYVPPQVSGGGPQGRLSTCAMSYFAHSK